MLKTLKDVDEEDGGLLQQWAAGILLGKGVRPCNVQFMIDISPFGRLFGTYATNHTT
jgi:hypothetical protein